jgi:hypothetical protein
MLHATSLCVPVPLYLLEVVLVRRRVVRSRYNVASSPVTCHLSILHTVPWARPTISRSDWIPYPVTPTVTQRIAHMQCQLVLENYDCTSHPLVQYRGHRKNPDKL